MDAEQRRFFRRNGYLVIKNALRPATVAALNDTVERELEADAKPESAIIWHLNRERETLRPDGSLAPRRLFHPDLILPPAVEPVLRELCSASGSRLLHHSARPL